MLILQAALLSAAARVYITHDQFPLLDHHSPRTRPPSTPS